MRPSGWDRRFAMLQGPHGPFFSRLGRVLERAGARVWRVGFNRGDQVFWHDAASFVPFQGKPEDWPETFAALVARHRLTDLVLYGDTRPVHAQAIAIARREGLRVHVFEEGYLRPYWISYERGGANGHSRLMQTTVDEMREALARSDTDLPDAPARWGELRQHIFWGALYHWFVMTGHRRFPNFRPHRSLTVVQEYRLYLRRLALLPVHALERRLATARIRLGDFPFHLVILQLEHDASFRAHSPFASMKEFLATVAEGFAKGAPTHHHLVFKAHPLEDGRVRMRHEIAALARAHGIASRVHFVRGGKLAGLLGQARSVVTVNSTAGQQVLWRGLPLRIFGDAVYSKPEFVSAQPLAEFFARPERPDARAYRDYRRYLLETSQVAGGFYSAKGRRELLRQIVDMILAEHDPYDALATGSAAPRQHLHAVL